MNNCSTVAEWLSCLEARHAQVIQLGLDRVATVAERMNLRRFPCPVITVAGTNGKGSTVATLESLAVHHGLRVACYTSPHLLDFNERIRVDALNIDDESLLQAFTAVEHARGDIALTYFEFTTLSALWIFAQSTLDLIVLEVGMGGRLDAVNVIDADVAVITTVDFDHMDYLGHDLASIAAEKAGICRHGKPVVFADAKLKDLLSAAVALYEPRICASGLHYFHTTDERGMTFSIGEGQVAELPLPQLGSDLVAAALAAWRAAALPWQAEAVTQAVSLAHLQGRWQTLQQNPRVVVDIGHNPQAARRIAERLKQEKAGLHLVVGMLADKDRVTTLAALHEVPARWYLCDLPGPRGGSARDLQNCLRTPTEAALFADPVSAWRAAVSAAKPSDLVLVWGSFLTVAAVMRALGDGCDGKETA